MKSILFTAATALLGTALYTQSDAPAIIKSHSSALHAAKSLKVEFSVQKLSGGGLEKDSLSYSKDGMFRIDTPSTLSVSDGKTVWTLNKAANTYTEGPASLVRTKAGDVWAWYAFFSEEAFKGVKSYSVKPSKTIRGNSVTEVEVTLPSDKTASVYIDNKLGFARGLVSSDSLILATTMEAGKEALDAKTFTFTPPAGATKEEIKPSNAASFADVQKILIANCQGCHNDGNAKAGLSVDSYAGIMKRVVAGDANSSGLYRSISGTRPKMPAGGAAPLSQKDRDTIAGWINAGAKNE